MVTTFGSAGGVENHMVSLIKELAGLYDIHVAYFLEVNTKCKAVFKDLGVDVIDLKSKNSKSDLSSIIRLYKVIKHGRYNLIHFNSLRTGLIGGAIANHYSIPSIASFHNYEESLNNRFISFAVNRVYRKFKKIICISGWLQDYLVKRLKLPKEKYINIHYGIEEKSEVGKDIRLEFGISEDKYIIGNVARLAPQKGHEYLLKAIKIVKEKSYNKEFHVIIVGHDDRGIRKNLEELTLDLGIKDKVTFSGYRDDISDFMNAFDLFVFPSIWEGFGLVLLEAMRFKKPIIATKIGPIPEIVINGETGILVEQKNTETLADSILQLMNNPVMAKQYGNNGFMRVKQHFSLTKMVHKIKEIYSDEIGI